MIFRAFISLFFAQNVFFFFRSTAILQHLITQSAAFARARSPHHFFEQVKEKPLNHHKRDISSATNKQNNDIRYDRCVK